MQSWLTTAIQQQLSQFFPAGGQVSPLVSSRSHVTFPFSDVRYAVNFLNQPQYEKL